MPSKKTFSSRAYATDYLKAFLNIYLEKFSCILWSILCQTSLISDKVL